MANFVFFGAHTLKMSCRGRAKRREKFVYYESIERKVQIKPICECRCDGRLQSKRFTLLSYAGLVVELKTDKDEVNKREVCECEG